MTVGSKSLPGWQHVSGGLNGVWCWGQMNLWGVFTSLCSLPLGTVWLCDVSTHQTAGNTVTLDFVHCEL